MSDRQTIRSAQRAGRKYQIFQFLEGFMLVYPVYMILFAGEGFNYTELSWLMVFWCVPVVVLELPSGVLADRWSRKGVIAIGMVFKAAGFVLWFLSRDFAVIAAGFVLWGAQEAFASGSRQAYLYDALKERGLESAYDSVAGRGNLWNASGTAMSLAAGGAVFAWNPAATLLLSSGACLAAGLVAVSFRETPKELRSAGGDGPVLATIRQGLSEIGRDRAVLSLVIAGCLAGGAYGLIDEFDTLWAESVVGVPVAFVGLWGALRFGIEAAGGGLAGTLSRFLKLERTGRLRAFVAAAGALFVSAAFLPGLARALPYFLFYALMAAAAVFLEQRLQDSVREAGRATVLSIQSLAMTLAALLMSPLLGVLSDRFGLSAAVVFSGAVVALSTLFLWRKKDGLPKNAPPIK